MMTFSFFRAATLVGASMLLAKSVHAQIDLTTISNPDKASCVMHVIVCCSWYISLCHDVGKRRRQDCMLAVRKRWSARPNRLAKSHAALPTSKGISDAH